MSPLNPFEQRKRRAAIRQRIAALDCTWIDIDANLQFIRDEPFERAELLQIAESVFREEHGK